MAKAFSTAYHNVDMRRKLLRITESAISWIQRRCPHIAEINVYMVEPAKGGTPNENGEAAGTTGSVLRKMMTTDKKGQALPITEVVRLERKDNLFRYLSVLHFFQVLALLYTCSGIGFIAYLFR